MQKKNAIVAFDLVVDISVKVLASYLGEAESDSLLQLTLRGVGVLTPVWVVTLSSRVLAPNSSSHPSLAFEGI